MNGNNNRTKKLLFLGDVVNSAGRSAIRKYLPEVIKKEKPDFIIVNGENIADGGRGIRDEDAQELYNLGVDVITLGNHSYKAGVSSYLNSKKMIRPYNFPVFAPGKGVTVIEKNNFKYGVINLLGNFNMPMPVNHCFLSADRALKETLGCNCIFIDIHAQDYCEKYALAHYLNGKVTAIVGTHTHIPTNDCQVLSKGTAFQSDAGMCGSYMGIRGKHAFKTMNKFIYWPDVSEKQYTYNNSDEVTITGCLIYFDPSSAKATSIKPIIYGHYIYRCC